MLQLKKCTLFVFDTETSMVTEHTLRYRQSKPHTGDTTHKVAHLKLKSRPSFDHWEYKRIWWGWQVRKEMRLPTSFDIVELWTSYNTEALKQTPRSVNSSSLYVNLCVGLWLKISTNFRQWEDELKSILVDFGRNYMGECVSHFPSSNLWLNGDINIYYTKPVSLNQNMKINSDTGKPEVRRSEYNPVTVVHEIFYSQNQTRERPAHLLLLKYARRLYY